MFGLENFGFDFEFDGFDMDGFVADEMMDVEELSLTNMLEEFGLGDLFTHQGTPMADSMDEFDMDDFYADQGSSFDDRMMYLDTDGDGIIETVMADTDDNGVYDTMVQVYEDGMNPSSYAIYHDYDQDTVMDSGKQYIDNDLDGQYDEMIEMMDSDGDGMIDKMIEHLDLDGDMQEDFTITTDINEGMFGDTEFAYVSEDDDGLYMEGLDESDYGFSSPVQLDNFDPDSAAPGAVVGDPASSMEIWEFQGDTNRCALFSQKFVIEELTGQDVDIEDMVRIAEEQNWFSEDGGTAFLNTNKMLDYFGIENEMSFHNTVDDIVDCLSKGGKVIVGVDSGEIWYGETDNMFTPVDGADHALQVVGIDYSDPTAPNVILNDSGSPDGCGEMVPLDVFVNAWSDGDCQMIACY